MSNKNALISTAMFNTISNRKYIDNIDLIRPFVIYVIGKRFRINDTIDNSKIIEDLEKDFGFKKIPTLVVDKTLLRISNIDKALKKQNQKNKKSYKVKKELETSFNNISKNRELATKKIYNIIEKLGLFLKDKHWSKSELTNEDVEIFLMNFLEEKGLETLRCSPVKLDKNQINFFIGNFILHIQNSDEKLFNDFLDITTGYMISKVIYYEVNNDGEAINFSNVDFYIDTRLLLGMLRFKTDSYNDNCEMLRNMIISKGGSLKCFSHNFHEIESILESYKYSLNNLNDNKIHTLEFFDDSNYSTTDVDTIISILELKLNKIHINVVDTPPYVKDEYEHVLNEQGLRDCLVANISYTNKDGQSPDNDVKSIACIHRLRKSCNCNKLVNCKAFFITDNYQLARTGNKFIRNSQIIYKYGLVMEDVDLSTIIWLYDSSLAKDYSKKKLIENAMATQKISNNVRQEFLKCVDNLKALGEITDIEAAKIRSDRYMTNKVMELTNGDYEEVDEKLILSVKDLYDKNIINKKFKEQLQTKDDHLLSKNTENDRLQILLGEKDIQLAEKNRRIEELEEDKRNEIKNSVVKQNKIIDNEASEQRDKIINRWKKSLKPSIIIIMSLFLFWLFYDIYSFYIDNSKINIFIIIIKFLVGIIGVFFTFVTIKDKNIIIENFIKSQGTKAYEKSILKHYQSISEISLSNSEKESA